MAFILSFKIFIRDEHTLPLMMAIFRAFPGDTVWYLDNRLSQDKKWSFCESVPVITDIGDDDDDDDEEEVEVVVVGHCMI